MLDVSKIVPGNNARQTFVQSELDELAASIKQNGIIQPILLRPLPDGKYRIVAGERRFRACLLNEFTHLKPEWYSVREMTDTEEHMLMLTENMARKDLPPLEEMAAFHRLDKQGLSIAEIASLVGTNEDRVRRRLLLLNLCARARNELTQGRLPLVAAEALAESGMNKDMQLHAVLSWLQGDFSLQAFVALIQNMIIEARKTRLFDYQTYWLLQRKKQRIVLNGKAAKFRAPTRKDLPPVPAKKGAATGAIIYEWMNTLEAHGFIEEAQTVGTLLRALVDSRNVQMPVSALVDEQIEIKE